MKGIDIMTEKTRIAIESIKNALNGKKIVKTEAFKKIVAESGISLATAKKYMNIEYVEKISIDTVETFEDYVETYIFFEDYGTNVFNKPTAENLEDYFSLAMDDMHSNEYFDYRITDKLVITYEKRKYYIIKD